MDYIIKGRTLQSDINRYVTDTEVAEILEIKDISSRIGKIAYYLHDAIVSSSVSYYSGGIYFFNGQHYVGVLRDEFSDVIYDILRRIKVAEGDIVFRGRDIMRVVEVGVRKKQLDYDADKICFSNGVLDIKTKDFSNFSALHHIFGAVTYKYDAELGDADAYLWHRFLGEVLPEAKQRRMLQEYLGLLFVNRREVKLQCMLFMLGKGSNGKGVIFDTISGLIGRSNISVFSVEALTSSREKLHNLALMNGKRLNFCSDLGSKAVEDDAFKSLTAGEPQAARGIYKDPFMAFDIPFMIGNANKMPATRDLSHGFFRRVLILPFNVEIAIEKQNNKLAAQLESEYSAIFNWILAGKERLIRHEYKFSVSPLAEDAIREYRESANNLFEWTADRSFRYNGEDTEVRRWVMSTFLYENYKKWAAKYDEIAVSVPVFGVTLQDIGFKKKRYPNGQAYLVYGIPDGKYTAGIVTEEAPQSYIRQQAQDKLAEENAESNE